MEQQWFVADSNGAHAGPYDAATLRDRVSNLELDVNTPVWREGMPAWAPLGSVAGDVGLTEPVPAAMPPPLRPVPPAAPRANGAAVPPPPPLSVNPHAEARARGDAVFDESLAQDSGVLRAFVGPNFDRYQQQWSAMGRTQNKFAWNWAAFLFGCLWLAYRKMYLYTAAAIGALIILSLFEEMFEVSDNFSTATSIGCAVAMGMFGNLLYRMHAQRKLSELPRNGSLPDTVTAATHAGGTSAGAAIGVGVLFMLFFLVAVLAEM